MRRLWRKSAGYYDAENDQYNGPKRTGEQWATVFDEGKTIFTRKMPFLPRLLGKRARSICASDDRPPGQSERKNFSISRKPIPRPFHFWRVHEGVPGTAMPSWGLSLNEDTIWKIATYEKSFVQGSIRTIAGEISDDEGDQFDAQTHIKPGIAGTQADFQERKSPL